MITEKGFLAKVLEIGDRVKLGSVNNDTDVDSVWYCVFPENTLNQGDVLFISRFEIESVVKTRDDGSKYTSVTIRILGWKVVR